MQLINRFSQSAIRYIGTLLLVVTGYVDTVLAGHPSTVKDVDRKVQNLLKQMTLEEKVGQMTQITLEVVARQLGDGEREYQLDPGKLREAILSYQVGSILNTGGTANTLDKWNEIITTIQTLATRETRLGIPVIYGIDAIHGANFTTGATLFPHNIALAATGNVELVRRSGEITAREVRASGIPWNFGPVLGVGRQPLWPRFFETFGEDVYLVSTMGIEYISGLQGNNLSAPGRIGACLKHYLGYSFPLSGKDRTPAWIPDRMLREYFLPPFAAAVKAGAPTVMLNSTEINGIPVHSNHYLVTELLKKELGFKGFVVSDWNDINNLYTREKIAADQREAVKTAVLAGVDMSMVPLDFSFYEQLLLLVNAGEVPESRIDDAVGRILRVKFMLGLFDNPFPNPELRSTFANPEFQQLNLAAAREAITLLKNEPNLLPLSKQTTVLVTGPTANLLSVLNGGWTITWQGDNEKLYPQEKKTILEAIQDKIGPRNVRYVPGTTFDQPLDIGAALEAAQKVDVIVACLGEPAYCETPGNINDLTLAAAQLDLVEDLGTVGKPIVLVLAEGRPRVIRRIADTVDAVLLAYLPGMEGGVAVADILFGDVNPSGKLPFSYPQYPAGFLSYDYKLSDNTDPNQYDPQWPFGYGLSYTTFAYDHLVLDQQQMHRSGSLAATVTVKNTGQRSGKEIVQLYVTDVVGSVTRPVKQLKRFEKIELQPGEEKTVAFTLSADDLAFIGRNHKRIVEPGEFILSVGDLWGRFILVDQNQ